AKAEKKMAPPPADEATATASGGAAGPGPRSAPSPQRESMNEEGDDYGGEVAQAAPRTNRLGLGTEFGESRYSAASFTKFVRSSTRPIAVAELRYNDA